MVSEFEIKSMFNRELELLNKLKKDKENLQSGFGEFSQMDYTLCGARLTTLRKILGYWSNEPFKY